MMAGSIYERMYGQRQTMQRAPTFDQAFSRFKRQMGGVNPADELRRLETEGRVQPEMIQRARRMAQMIRGRGLI